MDEGVDPVDPVNSDMTCEEPLLDGDLPKDVQPLLEVYKLEGMSASGEDSAINDIYGRQCPSDLIDLASSQWVYF